MNRLSTKIDRALLASLLTIGVGMFAGTAAANPTDVAGGYDHTSSPLLSAQAYLYSDKPPYVRHSGQTQQGKEKQLEKSEFARFEEKPAVADEGQKPTYLHVPGAKPPYIRIPATSTPTMQ